MSKFRILLVFVVVVFFSMRVAGDVEDGVQEHVRLEGPVAATIWWLTENQPQGCRARDDSVYRRQVAEAISAAANRWRLPTHLLTGMAYRETIFNPTVVGPAGERGLFQVGRYLRNRCSVVCADGATLEEQADCGACGLTVVWNRCGGDMSRALVGYASGRCQSDHPRVINVVNARIRLWGKLTKLVGQVDGHSERLWADIPLRRLAFLTKPEGVRTQGLRF